MQAASRPGPINRALQVQLRLDAPPGLKPLLLRAGGIAQPTDPFLGFGGDDRLAAWGAHENSLLQLPTQAIQLRLHFLLFPPPRVQVPPARGAPRPDPPPAAFVSSAGAAPPLNRANLR